MRAAPARSPATLVAAGALLATALFFGDGTSGGRLFWIGSLSVIAAVVLLWAGPVPVPRALRARPRSPCSPPSTLWVGLTMWWSIAPDLSGRRSTASSPTARSRCSACSPAASSGRRAPSPPGSPSSRSRARLGAPRQGDPLALPGRRARRASAQPGRLLELARARRGHRDAARPLGGVAPPLARGARGRSRARLPRRARRRAHLLAGRDRRRGARRPGLGRGRRATGSRRSLALVMVTPVAALVALWAFSRPAITDDLQPYADRVNDGAWFGVLACRSGWRSSRRSARRPDRRA